jgi:hypothetical protein
MKQIQDRSNSAELLEILGGYIDNCIMPLRRMYAWGVPTSEALQAIRKHAPPGLVYSMLCALNVVSCVACLVSRVSRVMCPVCYMRHAKNWVSATPLSCLSAVLHPLWNGRTSRGKKTVRAPSASSCGFVPAISHKASRLLS